LEDLAMVNAAWERILVATDLSPSGNYAIEYAHSLAERCGAELHVLHVTRNPTDAAGMFGATGAFEATGAAGEGEDWVRTILGESGSVRRVEALQIGADVAKKIKNYVRANNIDLLVMATHGRNGIGRLLLGSVTEEVIRSAKCPVLVLPLVGEKLGDGRAGAEPSEKIAKVMKD
jgi:nucleotide-binding universal stress UspA family protein